MCLAPSTEMVRRLEALEITAWGAFYRAAPPESVQAAGITVWQEAGVLTALARHIDVLAFTRDHRVPCQT